jgi:signal transduction histidine kinase/ligand-binding sensor domain-containing protein
MPVACALLVALLMITAPSALGLDQDRGLTQYAHRIWQIAQGLPEATIYSVHQSRDGYLWLGTLTGLVRFDGIRFTRISETGQDAIGRIPVVQLVEDSRGSLWVATDGRGVFCLPPPNGGEVRPEGPGEQAVVHLGTKDGLPSDRVRALLMDREKVLWIGTARGLVKVAGGKVEKVLEQTDVRALCEDGGPEDESAAGQGSGVGAGGGIYAAGEGNTVTHLVGGRAERRTIVALPAGSSIQALQWRGETLWVGSSAGIVMIRGSQERRLTQADGLANDFVLSLEATSDGLLWAGTQDGFSRVGPPMTASTSLEAATFAIDSFRGPDGLSQSTVYGMAMDLEGSLWVATKHGLNQFLDGRTIPVTVREGLPSNNTGPILQDLETAGGPRATAPGTGETQISGGGGLTWIGTLDSGLSRYDGSTFRTLTVADGLPSNRIVALARQGTTVWAGTDRGLAEVAGQRVVRQVSVGDGLPSEQIRCMAGDRGGALWVGTTQGLAVLRRGADARGALGVSTIDALRGMGITALLERQGGSMIAATSTGRLVGISGDAVADLLPPGWQGIDARTVDALYEDPQGSLWIGTVGNGLWILDKSGKVGSLSTRDGLFDDDLFAIVPDHRDRVWFACSKGLFSVSQRDVKACLAGSLPRIAAMPMSPTDVLRTIECKPGVAPAAARMADGKLWFATTRGVTVVDPERLPRRLSPPPVLVEEVSVDGRRIEPQAIGQLAPGRKNISLQYTALSFIAPARVIFRYMLEGYDKEWVDAGTIRDAQYTNLPPGPYTFRVRAVYPDGAWDDPAVKTAAVHFTLAPQWYQHAWFVPLCIILALLLGAALFWARLSVLRRRMALVVAERGRIARELHDTLLQGLSGVTMEMQALSVQLPESEQRRTLEEIIHDAAQCLREARRSIAGLRGGGNRAGLPQLLLAAMNELTAGTALRTRSHLPEAPLRLPANTEYTLMRIAREAITNAVRHSAARTLELTLTLQPGRGEGELVIRDDGIGFSPGQRAEGHFGILGMRERAAEIGGELEIVSTPHGGASVTIRFPLEKVPGAAGRGPSTLSAGEHAP